MGAARRSQDAPRLADELRAYGALPSQLVDDIPPDLRQSLLEFFGSGSPGSLTSRKSQSGFQPSLTGTLNLGRTNAFFLGGFEQAGVETLEGRE